eukprot:gene35150-20832_t
MKKQGASDEAIRQKALEMARRGALPARCMKHIDTRTGEVNMDAVMLSVGVARHVNTHNGDVDLQAVLLDLNRPLKDEEMTPDLREMKKRGQTNAEIKKRILQLAHARRLPG